MVRKASFSGSSTSAAPQQGRRGSGIQFIASSTETAVHRAGAFHGCSTAGSAPCRSAVAAHFTSSRTPQERRTNLRPSASQRRQQVLLCGRADETQVGWLRALGSGSYGYVFRMRSLLSQTIRLHPHLGRVVHSSCLRLLVPVSPGSNRLSRIRHFGEWADLGSSSNFIGQAITFPAAGGFELS